LQKSNRFFRKFINLLVQLTGARVQERGCHFGSFSCSTNGADYLNRNGGTIIKEVIIVMKQSTIIFWIIIALSLVGLLIPNEFVNEITLVFFFLALGIFIFYMATFHYSKEIYLKQNYSKNLQTGEKGFDRKGWLLFGKILDFIPWWILKIIYIFLGLAFIAVGTFLISQL
jgi:hypothetical protein